MDSWQDVSLQICGWVGANNSLLQKKSAFYEMLHRALNLVGACEYDN